MSDKKIKLSASQVYAIEYLQGGKVFVSYNSHLHASTVKFLLKHGIVKKVDTHYIELTDSFKRSNGI